MTVQTLPAPSFFNASAVDQLWPVPYLARQTQAGQWAEEHGIRTSWQDYFRICLLLIDEQITFCLPPPHGQLFVAGRSGNGAVEDAARVCEFIYRNLPYLTEIHATLDTHRMLQIFHPYFWLDEEGNHPAPMTEISLADLQAGKWVVNPVVSHNLAAGDVAPLEVYALHYAAELEKSGKYPLIIWPYHGMLGGIAHALVPAIEEACFFHAVARGVQTHFEVKGSHLLTENYSVLSPEVTKDAHGTPIGRKNTQFLDRLLSFNAIVIAGQAKSHCMAWSIQDLLTEIQADDPALAQRVYLLEDCTSSVVVPGVVDYTDEADAAYERFAAAGMHIVKSTDPLDSWPGIKL